MAGKGFWTPLQEYREHRGIPLDREWECDLNGCSLGDAGGINRVTINAHACDSCCKKIAGILHRRGVAPAAARGPAAEDPDPNVARLQATAALVTSKGKMFCSTCQKDMAVGEFDPGRKTCKRCLRKKQKKYGRETANPRAAQAEAAGAAARDDAIIAHAEELCQADLAQAGARAAAAAHAAALSGADAE